MATEWVGIGKTEDDVEEERDAFLDALSDEEKTLRERGQFFTPIESLWGTALVRIEAQEFKRIRRQSEQGKAYELCSKYIDDESMEAGVGSRSGKTNANKNTVKVDAYGNYDCDSAHLISHAEVLHKAFGFLGEAGIGKQVETLPRTSRGRRPTKRRKLGGKSDAVKRLMILNGVRGKNNTSLKSHKYKKMYLEDQDKLYDTEDPSIIVIPLLSLPDVLDWAKDGRQQPYDVLTITCEGGKSTRRASKILTCAREQCGPEDIENARILLEAFVKGVAGSLKGNNVFESFTHAELNNSSNVSLMRWKQHVEPIQGGTQKTVIVPTRRGCRYIPANVHVAKARLSTGNSLPDPWLVMIKAAINYSASTGMKLMPACQPPVEDDGPPNTIQGMDLYAAKDDSVDHAQLLVQSKLSSGKTVEMYDGEASP